MKYLVVPLTMREILSLLDQRITHVKFGRSLICQLKKNDKFINNKFYYSYEFTKVFLADLF